MRYTDIYYTYHEIHYISIFNDLFDLDIFDIYIYIYVLYIYIYKQNSVYSI